MVRIGHAKRPLHLHKPRQSGPSAGGRISHARSSHIILAVCAGSYLLGLVLGAYMLPAQKDGGFAGLFALQFVQQHLQGSAGQIWRMDFLSSLFLLAVLLFCAFSALGAPVAALVPMLRGICSGMPTGWLYLNCGNQGVLLNLLIFWLPGAGISLLTILLAQCSVRNSLALIQVLSGSPKPSERVQVRRVVQLFLIAALLALACSVIQAGLSALFGPVFQSAS